MTDIEILIAQLRSNADAHHESQGAERRRAADALESQQAKITALEAEHNGTNFSARAWRVRAEAAEAKITAALGWHDPAYEGQGAYAQGHKMALRDIRRILSDAPTEPVQNHSEIDISSDEMSVGPSITEPSVTVTDDAVTDEHANDLASSPEPSKSGPDSLHVQPSTVGPSDTDEYEAGEHVTLLWSSVTSLGFRGIGGDAVRLIITREAWTALGEPDALSVSWEVVPDGE